VQEYEKPSRIVITTRYKKMLVRLVLGVAILSLAYTFCNALGVQAGTVETRPTTAGAFGQIVHGLALSISTAKPTYRDGEPIMISVAIRNVGSPTSIFRSGFIGEYKFDIRNMSRATAPPSEPLGEPREISAVSAHFWPLGSNATYTTSFRLDNYFDLQPGTYRVTATSDVAIQGESLSIGLSSNSIVITVEAR